MNASRLAAAAALVFSLAACRSREKASDIDLQVGHDAKAAPSADSRNPGTGAVYRIARIDRQTKTVTLRPVDPAMTVSVDAKAKTPALPEEILGFADLEHLVGGGKSADEIVAGMEEGGQVTLFRDASGHLRSLSY